MAVLSQQQVYAYARAAGANHNEAVLLTAIAGGESGYDTIAHNPDASTGDNSYGLWQINMLGQMGVNRAKTWGLSSYDQLFDPMTNAKAAVSILRSQGWNAWTIYRTGAHQKYMAGATAAGSAVGDNYQSFLSGGGAPAPTPATSPTPTGGSSAVSAVPTGGFLVTSGGKRFIFYEVVPGIAIQYEITSNVDTSGLQDLGYLTATQYAQRFPKRIGGGNALELDQLKKDFGSYSAYWDWLVKAYMGPNPAKNDPGVLAVLAEVAARPDMSAEELQNLLKGTTYYQNRTEAQLEWNDLSRAEQEKRIQDTAVQLVESYQQLTGHFAINVTNGTIQIYAKRVASGAWGFGTAVEEFKKMAIKNPESPWSRTVRNEKINQGQFEVDVENAGEQARQLAHRWGVQLSDKTLAEWGNKLTMNQASEADLIDYLKKQAAILYPWKDPEQETIEAAEPWLQTYSRVMERNADIFNPEVQRALAEGAPVFDFEQTLRSKDEWLQTRNASDTLTSMAGEIGRRMGFA